MPRRAEQPAPLRKLLAELVEEISPATAANDEEPAICQVTGAGCHRTERAQLPACRSRCARAEFLAGLPYEVQS
jgi:hypothetical protein